MFNDQNNNNNVQFTPRSGSRNFMNSNTNEKKTYTTLHDWFFDWAKTALNI